ncbi:hypothetical protein AOQ84DRAFT_36322 [Glonium stellatum]|uniref:Uncharacterized protein n=1 Tax=Glonium stellatum TaxID=574774 RepID=A0A8E2F1R1_9PEZI|nr:hypothetical protein AOQ84DRAFT_36322 [Glonium stellatum]
MQLRIDGAAGAAAVAAVAAVAGGEGSLGGLAGFAGFAGHSLGLAGSRWVFVGSGFAWRRPLARKLHPFLDIPSLVPPTQTPSSLVLVIILTARPAAVIPLPPSRSYLAHQSHTRSPLG